MTSPPGRSLAQQLKQLEAEDSNTPTVDVDSAYSSIEPHAFRQVEKEHYLDVGPSRLRREVDSAGLGERYEGKRVGRVKIFEDDDEEDDVEENGMDGEDMDEDEDEEGDEDEDEDEEDEEDEDEEDEDEEGEDDGDGEHDEEEEEDDDDAGQGEEHTQPPVSAKSSRPLDPLSSLREARLKDIEKGKAIRRQKALFESLITLRITFQKALIATSSIPRPFPSDQSDEITEKKEEVLQTLGELSEQLFQLREGITLPGVELGKRKRSDDEDVLSEDYWREAGGQSLEMVHATRAQMIPILNKWSTKIQAASIQVGGKQGSSKFLQSTKGNMGIIEAIEAGVASKRDSDKSLLESEEVGYRALLREVIEARSGGSGSGIDLTHLRKEKKKKREAERGGSKGRKLRYTVHDKAQNFTVASELPGGWHDEQIDELFSSLLGGAGTRGATAQKSVIPGGTGSGIADGIEGGLASLGGLRVF